MLAVQCKTYVGLRPAQAVMLALKGNEDKVKIVLNKADCVDGKQLLMRKLT